MDWNNVNTDKDTSGLGPIEYDQSKVPQLIRKHADNVRGKSYGQEIREAQARNAEYAGLIASESMSIANNADLLSKDTQNRFNDQMAGNTDINEVIDARRPAYAENTYATLNERLNAENDILKTLVATQVERTSDVYYLADYPLIAPEFGDSARIQRALDEMAENGGGTLSLPSGKNINIDSEILVTSAINIVGNKSRLTVTGNLVNAITVNGSNVTLTGFDINKSKDNTTSTAIKLIGIKHLVTNISSFDSKWTVFIRGEKLKESHFAFIRIDNDVIGFTGTIFQFDYSVNNTLTNSMFGHSNMGVYLSSATDPTNGNRCEGLLIGANIIVKTKKAVVGDWATFLTVTNSILDFCSNCGVEITNGHSNIVSGTWINLTEAGNAIVFTQFSASNKALGNTIVGVSSVSGQSAFSVGAPNSILENNNISNADGGVAVAGVLTRNNIVTNGNALSDNPVVKETVQKGVSTVYFTRANNIIEIEIWEQGTSNYLFARGFKGTNNVNQHVLKTTASNGTLALGAANAQGTQQITGFATLANLVIKTKETRI